MMLQFAHYLQIIAFCTGAILCRKSWDKPYKALLILTGISVVTELAGFFSVKTFHVHSNNLLYNIYVPVMELFFAYIFIHVIHTAKIKKAAFLTTITFVSGLFISYAFHLSIVRFNNYALTIGLICSVVFAALFFLDSMINPLETPILKQPAFWFSTGVLMMSVLSIARFVFFNLIRVSPDYQLILRYIINVSNFFLYGSYILTFICLKTNRTYASQL